MVSYLGDFPQDQTVFIAFNTFDSNDPSASVTITNLADTDIHIHKDDGTTQHSSATDVDVQIDFDSITGNHMVEIRTTNVFFTGGADYFVRMEGTTIDGATVNAWIAHFSIENRSNALSSAVSDVKSQLVVVASDVVQIYSDTTAIHSDTTIIASDVVVLDNAVSDVESSLVIIKSDLVVIDDLIDNEVSDIKSQLVVVASDVVQIYSDTTAIEASGGSLTAAQDSKLTKVTSDVVIVGSDTAVIEAFGAPPTAAAIADQVWTESLEDHDVEGQAGWSQMLKPYDGEFGPGVWIDDGAANTSTVSGTDGTRANPVSTLAAAKTIADAIKTKVYYIIASDLTLAATHEDWMFVGIGDPRENDIDLGSQDVDRSQFINIGIKGTQGGTQRITADKCLLKDPGAGTTTLRILARNCGIFDDIIVASGTMSVFDNCIGADESGTAAVVDGTNNTDIIFRGFRGGIEFANLNANQVVRLDGSGLLRFNANCATNADVNLSGAWRLIDFTAGMSPNFDQAWDETRKITLEDAGAGVTGSVIEEIENISGGLTAAQDSKLTRVQSDLIIVASDIVVIDDAVSDVESSLVIVKSDTAAIELQVGDNNAELLAISSELVLLTSIYSDTTIIDSCCTVIRNDLPTKVTKNVALNNFTFLMVDSTDHVTPKTGLTVTAQRSIDGAAFAAAANSVVEISNGAYKINLAAADLNGDTIMLRFTATGADDRLITIVTQPT